MVGLQPVQVAVHPTTTDTEEQPTAKVENPGVRTSNLVLTEVKVDVVEALQWSLRVSWKNAAENQATCSSTLQAVKAVVVVVVVPVHTKTVVVVAVKVRMVLLVVQPLFELAKEKKN